MLRARRTKPISDEQFLLIAANEQATEGKVSVINRSNDSEHEISGWTNAYTCTKSIKYVSNR